MREILFRGKSRDTAKWVFGDFVSDACGISHEECLNEYGDVGCIMTYVIPETVGQFIGLTDKSGKKIFEGDIVVYLYDNKPHLVEWKDTSCGFEPFSDSNENCGHCGGGLMPESTKVIGNIHDNPELLKEGAE